jgi:hypothetical protein
MGWGQFLVGFGVPGAARVLGGVVSESSCGAVCRDVREEVSTYMRPPRCPAGRVLASS